MKNPFPNLPRTWQRFNDDNGSLLAAGVAYYGALSFFPLLLTLISGVGLVLQFTDAGQHAEAVRQCGIRQLRRARAGRHCGRAEASRVRGIESPRTLAPVDHWRAVAKAHPDAHEHRDGFRADQGAAGSGGQARRGRRVIPRPRPGHSVRTGAKVDLPLAEAGGGHGGTPVQGRDRGHRGPDRHLLRMA